MHSRTNLRTKSVQVSLKGPELEAYTKRLETHNPNKGGPEKCQCGDHRLERRNAFKTSHVLLDTLST